MNSFWGTKGDSWLLLGNVWCVDVCVQCSYVHIHMHVTVCVCIFTDLASHVEVTSSLMRERKEKESFIVLCLALHESLYSQQICLQECIRQLTYFLSSFFCGQKSSVINWFKCSVCVCGDCVQLWCLSYLKSMHIWSPNVVALKFT